MVEIKRLEAIDDFRKLPDIEKNAWGFTDEEVERIREYANQIIPPDESKEEK